MYTLAIYLYTLGILLVSPFHRKARAMIKGRFKTFITLRKKIDKNKRYVWFHAASLGEFEQGRSLMERFRSLHPEYQILLTFFSRHRLLSAHGYARQCGQFPPFGEARDGVLHQV